MDGNQHRAQAAMLAVGRSAPLAEAAGNGILQLTSGKPPADRDYGGVSQIDEH